MSLKLFNHLWYYHLLKHENTTNNSFKEVSLEKSYPSFRSDSSFIVQWILPPRGPGMKDRRVHGRFENYVQFLKFIEVSQVPSNFLTFFEVLTGSVKAYLDIDVSREKYPNINTEMAEKMQVCIVDAVFNVFEKHGITLEPSTDILVFESTDIAKYSFHIIINNYCFSNIEECKYFYQHTINELDSMPNSYFGPFDPITDNGEDNRDIITREGKTILYSKFVDPNVYKKLQYFRLLDSGKSNGMGGRKRVKRFREQWIFRGNNITHRYRDSEIRKDRDNQKRIKQLCFEESLVGFTANCKNVSFPRKEEEEVIRIKSGRVSPHSLTEKEKNYTIEEINDSQAQQMINIFKKVIPNVAVNFKIGNIHGNSLDLLRENPCICPVCKRSHDSQNAKLQIWKNRITFHCYQDLKNPFLLSSDIFPIENNNPIENNKTSPIKLLNEEPPNIILSVIPWNSNVLDTLKEFQSSIKTNQHNRDNKPKNKEKDVNKSIRLKILKDEEDETIIKEEKNENHFLYEGIILKLDSDTEEE